MMAEFLGEPPIYWAKVLVFGSFLNLVIYIFTEHAYWVALPVLKLPVAYWLMRDRKREVNDVRT